MPCSEAFVSFLEVNTGIELLFFLQKNTMQWFFSLVFTKKTKQKTHT